MIHCKWEILQAKLFMQLEREMGNKKTAGDKNVCE
jgi:hypothetical protein